MSDSRPSVEELITATKNVIALGDLTDEEAEAVGDAIEHLAAWMRDASEE